MKTEEHLAYNSIQNYNKTSKLKENKVNAEDSQITEDHTNYSNLTDIIIPYKKFK